MIQCNEAPSNCSGRTRLTRLPLRHPVISCINAMLSVQCEVTVLLCESNRCCVLRMVGKYTFADMSLCIHYVWPCVRRWSCSTTFLLGRISGRRIPGRNWVLALICVIGKDDTTREAKDSPASASGIWRPGWHCWMSWDMFIFIMLNLCWLPWEGSCRTHCPTDWRVLHEQVVYTNHLWRVCGLNPQDYPGRAKLFSLHSGDIVPITLFFLSLVLFQERQDPLRMASWNSVFGIRRWLSVMWYFPVAIPTAICCKQVGYYNKR